MPPRNTPTGTTRSAVEVVKNQSLIAANEQIGQQVQGELFPVTETEVDGVQMGVLSDGTPYLTTRGLARMCGVDNTAILRLANNWIEEKEKPRGRKIQELLLVQGYTADHLYLKARGQGGEINAFTDAVCMAILEYYAFEASQGSSDIALRSYRLLARDSFRSFIYKRCHYDPTKFLSDSWKNFHARLLLNEQLPSGYFSIFKEIAELVLRMIQQGCMFDHHTVPDCSAGLIWSRHWQDNDFDTKYGNRMKSPHVYPEWFPQAATGPVDVWIYPNEALAAFRAWLDDVYIPLKFPGYIETKVKKGAFLPKQAATLLLAVTRKKAA